MQVLEDRSEQSRTTRLWVDNLIKPVMIMMLFIRAEREANSTYAEKNQLAMAMYVFVVCPFCSVVHMVNCFLKYNYEHKID